jgi:cold shock protein
MSSIGIVREYHLDEGWGVIDAEEVPGGCWVSFAMIHMDGYRSLAAGRKVRFEAENANQDGFSYRATSVWPDPDSELSDGLHDASASTDGYSSTLKIDADTV